MSFPGGKCAFKNAQDKHLVMFAIFGQHVLTLHDFPFSLQLYIQDIPLFAALMTDSHASALRPKPIRTRAWLIAFAVSLAVAIPILPMRWLGIPGPDFWPDMRQVVENGKSWFNNVTSSHPRTEGVIEANTLNTGRPVPDASVTAAEQVKILEGAARELNQRLSKAPTDPSLHNRLGVVYLSLGELDPACEQFTKAVSFSRTGIKMLRERMLAAKTAGATSEASQALLDASTLNVELSAAHSNLARVYERRGEHNKVMAELELLNREGTLFDNTTTQQQVTAQVVRPEITEGLARAESFMQTRQWPRAAAEYRRVLNYDPNIAMAHHRMGTIMAMCNDAPAAVQEFEAAAKLNPNSAQIHSDLGLAYQMIGMMPNSLQSFEKALALDPSCVDAAVNLSNTYSSLGKLEDASKVLVTAARNNPNSAKIHNNLGTIMNMQGQVMPAQIEFQKAVQLAPNMSSAHYGLGVVMMQTKNYLPAVREFKTALALNPGLLDAQAKIEEAYRKAGMASGSAQALN
jgi:tetratricopeptide (TPR) repeat protein